MTWAGRLTFLAFLGLAGILLAGPVFALLSMLFTLAFVGLMIWLPLQLLTRQGVLPISHHPSVQNAQQSCTHFWKDARHQLDRVQTSVRHGLSRAATAFIEIASGMMVGGLLLWVGAPHVREKPSALLAAALLGGLVGVFTACARLKSMEALLTSKEPLSN